MSSSRREEFNTEEFDDPEKTAKILSQATQEIDATDTQLNSLDEYLRKCWADGAFQTFYDSMMDLEHPTVSLIRANAQKARLSVFRLQETITKLQKNLTALTVEYGPFYDDILAMLNHETFHPS